MLRTHGTSERVGITYISANISERHNMHQCFAGIVGEHALELVVLLTQQNALLLVRSVYLALEHASNVYSSVNVLS